MLPLEVAALAKNTGANFITSVFYERKMVEGMKCKVVGEMENYKLLRAELQRNPAITLTLWSSCWPAHIHYLNHLPYRTPVVWQSTLPPFFKDLDLRESSLHPQFLECSNVAKTNPIFERVCSGKGKCDTGANLLLGSLLKYET